MWGHTGLLQSTLMKNTKSSISIHKYKAVNMLCVHETWVDSFPLQQLEHHWSRELRMSSTAWSMRFTRTLLFLSQTGSFARDSHATLGFRRGELIKSVEATPVCARWHFLQVNLQKILAAAQLMQSVRNAARPPLSCQSLLAGFTEALLGYKESSGKAIAISTYILHLKPCTEIFS